MEKRESWLSAAGGCAPSANSGAGTLRASGVSWRVRRGLNIIPTIREPRAESRELWLRPSYRSPGRIVLRLMRRWPAGRSGPPDASPAGTSVSGRLPETCPDRSAARPARPGAQTRHLLSDGLSGLAALALLAGALLVAAPQAQAQERGERCNLHHRDAYKRKHLLGWRNGRGPARFRRGCHGAWQTSHPVGDGLQ